MIYPFAKRTMITQEEAVDFIRTMVFKEQNKTMAGNTIRQHITRAVKAGKLPKPTKSSPIRFNAQQLFQWAVSIWPTLREVEGMPGAVQTADILDTSKVGDSASTIVIPANPAKFRDLYIEDCLRLNVLEPETVQQRNEIKALREQVKALQDKDAERRKKCGHRGK